MSYSRRLWLEDGVLVTGLVVVLALRPAGVLTTPLACAIALAITWSVLTLHVPSEVELSPRGIAFRRYGRTHAFAWEGVTQVRVRRFLTRDRVLVRLFPSPPWRGRYWIGDGLEGFQEVVARLEAAGRPAPAFPSSQGSSPS